MSSRKVSKRRMKKNSIGDRRDRIKLHVRSVTPPAVDSASFSESYDTGKDLWSKVETFELQGSGVRTFDGVNLNDERPTHRFTIRFNTYTTSENIIGWRGKYYRILAVINPEERNEDLELLAVLKGDSDLEANH